MKTLPSAILLLLVPIILLLSGCGGPPDHRIERMAKENADRQAEQNRQMAQQSQQITRTTGEIVQAETQARQDAMRLQRELAEADGRARQKILDMHQKVAEQDAQVRQKLVEEQQQLQARFQAERQNLDRQREGLETDRREIATQRIRDPVIADALRDVGLAALCILPLLLCGYLLYVLHRGAPDDPILTEVLVEEMITTQPRFLLPVAPLPVLDQPTTPLLVSAEPVDASVDHPTISD